MRTKTTTLVAAIAAMLLPAVAFAEPAAGAPAPVGDEPAPEPEPAPDPDAPPVAEAAAPVEPAAANDWTIGVAPRIGVTVPASDLGPMVVGGVEIDYALPVLDKRLVLALDLSITRPGFDGSGDPDMRVGGDYDYSIDVTELKVGLGAVYRVAIGDETLVPYGGAGVIMQMLKTTETTSIAPDDNTAQDTSFGIELVAGADYATGPGYALVEARFVFSDLDHLLTGDSNAGNVMLAAGYRLVF